MFVMVIILVGGDGADTIGNQRQYRAVQPLLPHVVAFRVFSIGAVTLKWRGGGVTYLGKKENHVLITCDIWILLGVEAHPICKGRSLYIIIYM